MNMKTPKGKGGHLARQLNASQKASLTIWLSLRREDCETKTAHELSLIASKELGFDVSESSINTHRLAVFPEMKKQRGGSRKCNLSARVDAIEARLSVLAKELGVQF